MNPSYDEVVAVLRQQLAETQFQLTIAQLTVEKQREYIKGLEAAAGLDEEDEPPTDS